MRKDWLFRKDTIFRDATFFALGLLTVAKADGHSWSSTLTLVVIMWVWIVLLGWYLVGVNWLESKALSWLHRKFDV